MRVLSFLMSKTNLGKKTKKNLFKNRNKSHQKSHQNMAFITKILLGQAAYIVFTMVSIICVTVEVNTTYYING